MIDGAEKFQPKPNGPLPAPESDVWDRCGPKPDRPGLVAIGTDIVPVPVTGLVPNFSPMPRMAPPPFGSETWGADTANDCPPAESSCEVAVAVRWSAKGVLPRRFVHFRDESTCWLLRMQGVGSTTI